MFSFRGDQDWSPFPNGESERSTVPFDPSPLLKWGLIVLGLIFFLILLNILRQIYTNWLWFDALDYRSVYVKIVLYRAWLFFVGALTFTAIVVPNAVLAYRNSEGEHAMILSAHVYDLLKRLFVLGIWLSIFLLAIIFGSVTGGQWETVLRVIYEVQFNIKDPVFDQDISFYVFTLPMLNMVQGWLLGTMITTMLITSSIYLINISLRGVKLGQAITPQIIRHASILLGLLLLIITWTYWIDRYELLFSSSGTIFGAAYTDLNARLPALHILIVIGGVIGLLLLANTYFRSPRIIVSGLGLWIAAAIAVGAIYPSLVQRFQVAPNELEKERTYIPRNLEYTRQGFALDRIVEEDYDLATIDTGDQAGELAPITAETIASNPGTIDNVRLWDRRPLRSIYNQIQFFRAYYRFVGVDIDRYNIDGEIRQVVLGARELFPEDLPVESQSWVNSRLQFTHGFGLAMSPTTEFTAEGKPEFFIKDIPPKAGKESLQGQVPQVTVPQIYYGENSADYVIVNSKETEFDFPAIDSTTATDTDYAYDGNGGVQLSSVFRRLAYAWEFEDINVLISDAVTSESRIQYRRLIQDRVKQIAPFLRLDSDPYLVVADGKLWWIQDAYTVSNHYPYSDPYRNEFNYIRNSVKAVVDAYTGEVDFYIFDEEDALIQTYARVFPSLFKPGEEMPKALQSHVRYPRDFFSIQAEKYLLYHMRDTTDFYRKEDPWSIPQELFFETVQPILPYHVIMKLPGEEKEEFVLMLPFTPLNKPNQVAWLAARMDNDRGQYGSLKAFFFPKGIQVDGPEQIEARIDQDFEIKKQFTLLCQRGARCIRGNLLVTPIEHEGERFLMYVEPLYIQAESIAFPELKQVIVADAKRVVMESDFQSALDALLEKRTDSVREDPTTLSTDPRQQQIEDVRQAIEDLQQTLHQLEEALEEMLASIEKGVE
ncbi:MAG: UPF0182 family protein [Dehalococcoidia bacterium]|nr:UPF0182 family protein [Dehalococcoidia bacterium]